MKVKVCDYCGREIRRVIWHNYKISECVPFRFRGETISRNGCLCLDCWSEIVDRDKMGEIVTIAPILERRRKIDE